MAEVLQWFGDYGFLRANDKDVYDREYFLKYVQYAKTKLGLALNHARVSLVSQYVPPEAKVLDIGIGCGHFLLGRLNTFGFDVNPMGISWLVERGLFLNPYARECPQVEALTFWDSLEHIEDPGQILGKASKFVFVSIPIFLDKEHVLKSKHYRPEEHWWFFLHDGFVRYMRGQGFTLQAHNRMETDLGREDIGTFVFRRVSPSQRLIKAE